MVAQRLGFEPYANATPLELRSTDSDEQVEVVIGCLSANLGQRASDVQRARNQPRIPLDAIVPLASRILFGRSLNQNYIGRNFSIAIPKIA
jgi:hypothetical protein